MLYFIKQICKTPNRFKLLDRLFLGTNLKLCSLAKGSLESVSQELELIKISPHIKLTSEHTCRAPMAALWNRRSVLKS